jgi:hypothetical protein
LAALGLDALLLAPEHLLIDAAPVEQLEELLLLALEVAQRPGSGRCAFLTNCHEPRTQGGWDQPVGDRPDQHVGAMLQGLRQQAGVTQAEIAADLEIDQS